MANPTTRTEFKEYCLRSLGDGVIQINVSDEQVEDRIDEAIYLYQQFHMDATVKNYLKHEVTPSTMRLVAANTFLIGEDFTGNTSHARGTVDIDYNANTNTMVFYTQNGTFVTGEVISGLTSGVVATVNAQANAIVLGDFDNKYIPIDNEAVISITKIFAPYDSRMSAEILFDPQSQFNISLLSNFTSNSIIPYVIGRQYQQLINDTFRGRPAIRFSRHQGRLFIDVNWATTFLPHFFLIVECFTAIDGDDFGSVWSDNWLTSYATALVKKQWGNNLKKYTGIALPGGVKLDGKTIYDEAVLEIKEAEDELRTEFQLPIDFIVG